MPPCQVTVPNEENLHAIEGPLRVDAGGLVSEMDEAAVHPQVAVLQEHVVKLVRLAVAGVAGDHKVL